jgi:hypothetical protein
MSIDRSNYEVWFIDWLDGNLNSFQTKELNNFLDLNPDLKEEFKDLSNIPLVSPEYQFQFKSVLKKSVEQVTESQFEFLSAAYLEKDLSDLQKSEIDEIIAKDPQKKRIFELINKTILSPSNIKYKYKKQLIKHTPVQKIIRLSVIGLSAAAVIAIIIATYITLPRNIKNNINTEALVTKPVMNPELPSNKNNTALAQSSGNILTEVNKKSENKFIANKSDQIQSLIPLEVDNNTLDSELRITYEAGVEKIKTIEFNGLNRSTITNELALSYIYVGDEEPENERSKIGKYIAKTFREKILKEKTPPDSPLKAYEIAEAGVTGINKLFGWEMALDKKSDENGDLKSVYFSSRIIKFNAPVKKSEPLP